MYVLHKHKHAAYTSNIPNYNFNWVLVDNSSLKNTVRVENSQQNVGYESDYN